MARTHTVLLPGLHFWRARRGYTQAQLADRIGMRRPTVWRIEAGRPARVRTAHLLATALGVHITRLQVHPTNPFPIQAAMPLPQPLPTRYAARRGGALKAARVVQARRSTHQAASGGTRLG